MAFARESVSQWHNLHLATSVSMDGIDRSVSVTIGVHLPCVGQGIDFYTLFLLQHNVNSKRRVVNYNE